MLPEARLRPLLSLIDSVPDIDINYNPLALIRIVNALQPLGKERALAAVREYVRVGNAEKNGLYLLLRALFEVPAVPGYLPDPGLGNTEGTLLPPDDRRQVPRFPLAIVDDVPLLLVMGYALEGHGPRFTDDLAFFQRNCRLRPARLRPPDNPAAVLQDLESSSQWRYERGHSDPPRYIDLSAANEEVHRFVCKQLLRTISSVCPVSEAFAESWARTAARAAKLGMHWDVDRNDYVIPRTSTKSTKAGE